MELPSSSRVTNSTGRWVVRPVMKTATPPKTGPSSMITLRPYRSARTPKTIAPVSSVV